MLGIYTRALANYPITTQAATTGTLFGTGDLVAQFLFEQKAAATGPSDPSYSTTTTTLANWDKARTARMAFFGAAFAGPLFHHWYNFLDKTIRLSTPVRSSLGRVAVDQIFFAPCFIASFFVGQGLLKGESWQTIQGRLKKARADTDILRH
ncbi:Protein required for ethanol metabolism [Mortierella sp. AD010]|nr:Protein required for ethanol metabolism [Mortierella sp. AD010]